MRSEADEDHRCYAGSHAHAPPLDHQTAFCLRARHTACPLYVPVDPRAPVKAEAKRRVPQLRWLPWLLAGVAIVIVAAVFGRDLLAPPAATFGNEFTAAAAPPQGAESPAAPGTPSAALGPVSAPSPVRDNASTPQADGRVLTLMPEAGDVGWWSSGQTRVNLADSFLYAGYYQGQSFVAVVRFPLDAVPRGAPINEAALALTGLNADRFDPGEGGAWTAQLLAVSGSEQLGLSDFQEIYNLPAAATLFPTLLPADLGRNVTNVLPLDPAARDWLAKQIVDGAPAVVIRIVGPSSGESVFAWDSGHGPATAGDTPRLVLNVGPPPPTPPPFPTEAVIVVTLTPTPANILTVAAEAATASALNAVATPTPVPYRMVTATPLPANMATAQALGLSQGLPPIVESTRTPANAATATYDAEYATAVAVTTGTFTPTPEGAVTPIIIMPTPIPRNVMTAAAQMRTATAVATRVGTPTLLPFNAVVATPTEEPFVIVNTETPANWETAQAYVNYATAVAATTGTFTPIPPGAIRATVTRGPTNTPAPTPTMLVQYVDQITPQPLPTPVPAAPLSIPAELKGKILFLSDRDGGIRLFSLDPQTRRLAYVAENWPHEMVLSREGLARDGFRAVGVAEDANRIPQVYVRDSRREGERIWLTSGAANSYDAVWSPVSDRIAYVSEESGNPEIYTVNADGTDLRRLTTNDTAVDRHPSWSPDGREILFVSGRIDGRLQLWIMAADGSNQRLFLESPNNDWDPVWEK
ncbi:MAG: hypothetical protein MUC34_11190 [Anaerolineae bacterium]|nr:hypothetical protein [Anaerolineae bacterium]